MIPKACVYFMKCDGFTKIGITTKPIFKRKRSIQTSNPHLVTVDFSLPCKNKDVAVNWESDLHSHFNQYHHRREWYDIPEKIYQEMKNKLYEYWPCPDYVIDGMGYDQYRAIHFKWVNDNQDEEDNADKFNDTIFPKPLKW